MKDNSYTYEKKAQEKVESYSILLSAPTFPFSTDKSRALDLLQT